MGLASRMPTGYPPVAARPFFLFGLIRGLLANARDACAALRPRLHLHAGHNPAASSFQMKGMFSHLRRGIAFNRCQVVAAPTNAVRVASMPWTPEATPEARA